MTKIAITPLAGLPEIRPGTDLATLLASALNHCGIQSFSRDDVLVVTQKIVSKALGLMIDLKAVEPRHKAVELAAVTGKDARLVELVLRESQAVVRAAPHVLITRHLSGCVMANAGIDASNLGRAPGGAGTADERVLLLPRDPDAQAAKLRAELGERLGGEPPSVIISDSFGRPWREGVTQVAIGAAGLPSLVDLRGRPDRDGRLMEMTTIALADQIACAAGLVIGEAAEGLPAALVTGLALPPGDIPAGALVRPVEKDLFR